MMCCQKQQVKQKTRVHCFMAPNHPSPPPPKPIPPLKPPKMGFWQPVVPKKTGGKRETEKKQLFFVPPVNPSTALVTGVCVTP